MKEDLYEKIIAYILDNQDRFYRLAYSYAKNQDDALDIVQNSVCKALANYESLREETAMKTWLYRIVVNESIHFIKKRKREILTDADSQRESPYYEKGYEPEDSLYEQIDRLDEDVQKIIKLRFYEELTLAEIAEVMEMNLNTVKAKLYRGLKILKQNIEEVYA